MKYIKPSWIIENKANTNQNLFSISNIENDFKSYTYICHCGRIKNIFNNSISNYTCKCGNNTFIESKLAIDNFKQFVEDLYFKSKVKIDFELNYKIDILDNKVQAICFTKIPIEYNESLNICNYKEIVIASVAPSKTNKIEEIQKPYSKEIAPTLKSMIRNLEPFEKYIDIKLSRKGSKAREEQIYFFLNHINLKDKEFMQWEHANLLKAQNLTITDALIELTNNKKFKSVKKAIYKNYEYQISQSKKYNLMFTYMATYYFNDPNFITLLIDMNNINNDKFLNNVDKTDLFNLMNFLLKVYTQKQICYFFKHFDKFIEIDKQNLKQSLIVFQDIIGSYKMIRPTIYKEFIKVRCTPRVIHDEFVRIVNKTKYSHLENRKLIYSEIQESKTGTYQEYDVKLPRNGSELYTWGDILHNCMATYFEEISNGNTIIYGFFKDTQIVFAVEIRDGSIWQAKGKYNRDLQDEEMSLVYEWFKNIF